MATAAAAPPKSLQDPELKEKLQQVRQTDNVTNIYYVLRTYLYLAAVIGGTLCFYWLQQSEGLSWWWNVPVTLVAIVPTPIVASPAGIVEHELRSPVAGGL